MSKRPVINNWQIDKGPFGVLIIRGYVSRLDDDGRPIPSPQEVHQLLYWGYRHFAATTNGKSETHGFKEGYPHADPYPAWPVVEKSARESAEIFHPNHLAD